MEEKKDLLEAGEGTSIPVEPPKGFQKLARNKYWKGFWSNLLFMAVWFVVFYVVFFVFPPYIVSGESMNKTLDHHAFGFGFRYAKINRGDIIVLQNEKTAGKDYVKRVIGIPGDKVEINGYEIKVNDEVIEEDYIYIDPEFTVEGGSGSIPFTYIESGKLVGSFVLGDNEYFVMGDNRCHSRDSRSIGPITKSDIRCKMLFFIWGKHSHK